MILSILDQTTKNKVKPMTADQYRSEILPEIYKRYSYKDGLFCGGRTKEGMSPIQICIPTMENPDSPWNPTTCYIWNRETLIYHGDLTNAALVARLCRKYKVCHFIFTTVSKMETSNDGVKKCICANTLMKTCKKKCKFKEDSTAILPAKVFG